MSQDFIDIVPLHTSRNLCAYGLRVLISKANLQGWALRLLKGLGKGLGQQPLVEAYFCKLSCIRILFLGTFACVTFFLPATGSQLTGRA